MSKRNLALLLSGLLSISLSFALSACGSSQDQTNSSAANSTVTESDTAPETMKATQEYTIADMTFSVPAEWSLNKDDGDSKALQFDTDFSGLLRVTYHQDLMNAFASTEDAAKYTTEMLSSVECSNQQKSKLGNADIITYDTESSSAKGKLSLIVSENDGYMIMFACPKSAWEGREEQYSSILQSISGVDKKPIFADITYDGNLSLLENAFKQMSTFNSIQLTGSGDDVVTLPTAGAPCLLTVNYPGSSNFAIKLYDANGTNLDLLVNEIGPYSGTVTTFFDAEEAALLEINASGDWAIDCLPFDSMKKANNGDTFHGDDVVYIDAGSISKVHFTHDGQSNFSVQVVGTETGDLLVNEIGPYDGMKIWTDPDSFFVVHADGNWSISW